MQGSELLTKSFYCYSINRSNAISIATTYKGALRNNAVYAINLRMLTNEQNVL